MRITRVIHGRPVRGGRSSEPSPARPCGYSGDPQRQTGYSGNRASRRRALPAQIRQAALRYRCAIKAIPAPAARPFNTPTSTCRHAGEFRKAGSAHGAWNNSSSIRATSSPSRSPMPHRRQTGSEVDAIRPECTRRRLVSITHIGSSGAGIARRRSGPECLLARARRPRLTPDSEAGPMAHRFAGSARAIPAPRTERYLAPDRRLETRAS